MAKYPNNTWTSNLIIVPIKHSSYSLDYICFQFVGNLLTLQPDYDKKKKKKIYNNRPFSHVPVFGNGNRSAD